MPELKYDPEDPVRQGRMLANIRCGISPEDSGMIHGPEDQAMWDQLAIECAQGLARGVEPYFGDWFG